MDQRSHSSNKAKQPRPFKDTAELHTSDEPSSDKITRRLTSLLGGLAYGGMAYLLGGCSLLFGSLPLGLAILCASSRHTWFILAGLLFSALRGDSVVAIGVWMGVYALALLLRLAVAFFMSPPMPPVAEPPHLSAPRREWQELTRAWAALKVLLWDLFRSPKCSTQASMGESPASAVHPLDGSADVQAIAVSQAGATSPAAARPHTTSRRRLFHENLFLRMITGSVCGFAAGLCGMFMGGFAFYDLFAALFTIVCVPVATFLLVPCFREEGEALLLSPRPFGTSTVSAGGVDLPRRVRPLTLISILLLLLTITYASRRHSFMLGTPYLTFQLAPLLAMLLTLSASARLGLVPGVTVAVLTGLGVDPLLAPAFVLSAVAYAALRSLSSRIAVTGGGVVALVWCAAVGGTNKLILYFFSLLLAIPIHLIGEHIFSLLPTSAASVPRAVEMTDFSAATIQETRADTHRARLRALSEAFSSLSRLFYDMSDRLRHLRMSDVHRVCEEAVEHRCATCGRRASCREGAHDRSPEIAAHLTVQLHTHGATNASTLPAELHESCPHLTEVAEDVNARYSDMTERRLKSEKTEVFASDYEAMAEILNDAINSELSDDNDPNHDFCDRPAADRIAQYLSTQGVEVLGAVVCGEREKRIVVRGTHMEKIMSKADVIHAALESICNAPLSAPVFEAGEGHTILRLHTTPSLDVSYAGSTVPAGTAVGDVLPAPLTGETAPGAYVPPYTCGDHIALFTGERAYFYALISDGMGSGEEASLTSDICTVFLEKMLSAGNRADISLHMLGSFIRQKNTGTGGECSATVDLMELDLFCGEAVFIKNGAAPTYVVRKGTVYKLRSRTMPIGILKDTPAPLLRFRTHPGDVVVMVSDGVTLGNDECPWLIDMLSEPLPQSMDALRLDILKHAIASGSPDDLSAIAVRVEETTHHAPTNDQCQTSS